MTSCPSRFNLTFSVPRSPTSRLPEAPTTSAHVQTFEVALDDTKRVYRLLLTYFRSVGAAGHDGSAERGVAAEAYSSKVVEGHTAGVTEVVTACVMMVVICLSVRLLCDVALLRREKPTVTGDPDDVTRPHATKPILTAGGRQRRHLVFISVYIGFNVVYSLLVTFTAISAAFLFHFRYELGHVTAGGEWLGELTRQAIGDVELTSERSMLTELRLAESRVRQVPAACTRHLDDMTYFVQQSLVNVSLRHQRQRNSTSVSGLILAVINWTVADAERRVSEYVDELNERFQRRADSVVFRRDRYRHQVVNSVWLLYARSLFNRTVALSTLTTSSSSSSSSSSSTDGIDEVMRFLDEMLSVYDNHRLHWLTSAPLQRSVVTCFVCLLVCLFIHSFI